MSSKQAVSACLSCTSCRIIWLHLPLPWCMHLFAFMQKQMGCLPPCRSKLAVTACADDRKSHRSCFCELRDDAAAHAALLVAHPCLDSHKQNCVITEEGHRVSALGQCYGSVAAPALVLLLTLSLNFDPGADLCVYNQESSHTCIEQFA